MTLFEIHVELSRVADSLDRIVFLLDRLVYPPAAADVKTHQATLDDLHIVTPEDVQRGQQEVQALAERYRAVPGSEAFAQALVDWEQQQRSIHGESWQVDEGWQAIFAAAERGRPGRKEAGSAAAPADRG